MTLELTSAALRNTPLVSVRALSAPPTDSELHAVRIRAKRCRYLAEDLVPIAGKEAGKFATACRRLQDVLGEHQDTVVVRERLRNLVPEVSAWKHLPPANSTHWS